MHQSFASSWQLRMQTASAQGSSAGTVHWRIFKWEEWTPWEWEVLWGLTRCQWGWGCRGLAARDVCVIHYRFRLNDSLLPLIFGAVWGSRGEEELKCQLCAEAGEFPALGAAGQDEGPSRWEHLIRRAESSRDKSGSSCHWLGGIN